MGHPHFQRDAAGNGDSSHYSDDEWEAPRLAKALLEAPAGTSQQSRSKLENAVFDKQRPPVTAATLDTDLPDLLWHIQDRLFSGVTEAWFSPQGYGAWPDFEMLKSSAAQESFAERKTEIEQAYENAAKKVAPEFIAARNEPEEQWARAMVERFVFTAYGGPGVNHGTTDTDLYQQWPQVSPLLVACQHLATYCLLSRGVPLADIGGGNGCGCSGGVVSSAAFAKGFHKTFARGSQLTRIDDLANLKGSTTLKKITPGSVVVFNPGGPDYPKQDKGATTHIATVLRVAGNAIQFFDTGVVVGNQEGGGTEGGTADHSFARGGTISASTSLVGVGALPPPQDPSSLVTQANAVASARPLGVARLIIIDPTNTAAPVRFISKLLQLRYPVSYLVWSLRGLPVKGLSVLWYVYAKKNDGSLLLVNVIRGNDDGKASAFRGKFWTEVDKEYQAQNPDKPIKYLPKTGWYRDLLPGPPNGSPAFDEMCQSMKPKLPDDSDTTLFKWCRSQPGKRFLQKANEPKGAVDEGTTGVFDS